MHRTTPLKEAGLTVYQKASKEHLALAHIAEESERPQYWFACNILKVVGIHGSAPGSKQRLHLTREIATDLKLSDDMTALTGESAYTDLCLTGAEIEQYMAWARMAY